jgi:hypothetical protein
MIMSADDVLVHIPDDVFANRPNCQCPACGVDMMIAGWYDKPAHTIEGKTIKSQHECYSCGKFVIPIPKVQST